MGAMTWLMATHNQGKIKELRVLLKDCPVRIVGLGDLDITAESPESGATFLENAMQKAAYYKELCDMPVLADDSGLEVDALNGAPGIHSARFGGLPDHAQKCRYLLRLLEGTEAPYRTARFHCAAAYFDGTRYITTEDSLEGFIGPRPVGDGGFGYDPIFHPQLDGPSLAQVDMELKNRISHRGKAFRQLVTALTEEIGLLQS